MGSPLFFISQGFCDFFDRDSNMSFRKVFFYWSLGTVFSGIGRYDVMPTQVSANVFVSEAIGSSWCNSCTEQAVARLASI